MLLRLYHIFWDHGIVNGTTAEAIITLIPKVGKYHFRIQRSNHRPIALVLILTHFPMSVC